MALCAKNTAWVFLAGSTGQALHSLAGSTGRASNLGVSFGFYLEFIDFIMFWQFWP